MWGGVSRLVLGGCDLITVARRRKGPPFLCTAGDRLWPILLQKSKVAAPRNFRENKKRETITDSYTLNRAAKVADEFNVRGSVPSHLYTKDAPTARRIFGHLCKTTFATQSAQGGRRNAADPRLLSEGFCCKTLFLGGYKIFQRRWCARSKLCEGSHD
jgi:hypothetical protein